MITLPRLLKIGLPITTVATATAVTVSLICLYRNEDKDKKDLNNELLNDFQENLKPFQEKTVSYAIETTPKGETGSEEGEGEGSLEIILDGSGGTSVGNGEEAAELGLSQALEGTNPDKQETLPSTDSQSDISHREGEPTASSEEGRETVSEDDANENLSRDSNQGLPEGRSEDVKEALDDGADGEKSQYSVQEAGLSTQLGTIPETAEGVKVVQTGQGERGVSATEPEHVAGSTSEVIDNSGRGTLGEGIDPDSTNVEESQNLEEEIKLFEGLGIELNSNRFQLDQVLL